MRIDEMHELLPPCESKQMDCDAGQAGRERILQLPPACRQRQCVAKKSLDDYDVADAYPGTPYLKSRSSTVQLWI